jgi:hypothetical protein
MFEDEGFLHSTSGNLLPNAVCEEKSLVPSNSIVLRRVAAYALLMTAIWPFPSLGQTQSAIDTSTQTHIASNGAKVDEISAAPEKGFDYPYLLFLAAE